MQGLSKLFGEENGLFWKMIHHLQFQSIRELASMRLQPVNYSTFTFHGQRLGVWMLHIF